MSLKDVQYQIDYRSGYDNIVNDFFRPSLIEAKSYWRAVGYFSSSALESFGSPLGEFVSKGGTIRLITSVALSKRDLEVIKHGASKRDICTQRLEQTIEAEFADGVGDGTTRLARLLDMGRLEIRIAIPKTGTGIYHEKIGLFFDGNDYVAFTGSSNESRNAFENNRECMDVYSSWESPRRAERKRTHFESLWNRDDEGVEVYDFPDAARKKLLQICMDWVSPGDREKIDSIPQSTEQGRKWRHQDEALEIFLASERGVLNMATGTGKTRTALKIMQVLFSRARIDTVIVCTDGNDLLDQWYSEILTERDHTDRNLSIFRNYRGNKELQGFLLDPENAVLLVSRKPVASVLQRISNRHGERTLLIHDEVHGLGSPANRDRLVGLSDHVRFRLGLSATPEREYDQKGEGNDFIERHIGPVLMTFGLREAIERGILAPFSYYPLPFTLTESDRDRIASIYHRKKASELNGTPMSEVDIWIAISQVYKTSEAKLPVFANFIKSHKEFLTRCIVFADTREYGASVLDHVHQYRSDFHTYYSGEDAQTLKRFAQSDLECLITCHRLSEGIDIKSLNNVILFSSARACLELIQRIGRCLRTDPDNPDKVANIVDFIRNGTGDGPNADEVRRDWLMELSKVRPTE